jgi:hypothetical protein
MDYGYGLPVGKIHLPEKRQQQRLEEALLEAKERGLASE